MPEPTQHDRLIAVLAEGLKAAPEVAAFAGDRIHVGEPADPADPALPCVILGKGRTWPGVPGHLQQFGVSVECRAGSKDERDRLIVAAQRAVNGFRRGEVKQCVLTDTGVPTEADGVFARVDRFGVFAKLA